MRFGKVLTLFAFALFAAAGAAIEASAQGVIVPRPCWPRPRCPIPPRPVPIPRALPVKSIKIETKIAAGQVATTRVEQVFRNDTGMVLEGTYFFPIPETASVSEFAIWDGDRRLVGEVRSREEARRIYDEIVRRQRDPGLLEYAGRDLFQASVFPIAAHSDKKIELTYTQVLRAESGTVAYRYPLGTGRNASPVIGTVSGSVQIDSPGGALRNVYSPTHDIDVRRSQADRRAELTFESKLGQEPRDFQLFYTATDKEFGLTLLTHREPGKDGYFLLTLSAPETVAREEYATGKDIVFVLDTSGSMSEEGKMEKARAALLFGVKNLRPADRFNVISFAGEEHLMSGGLVQADEAGRALGAEFVRGFRPVGGTNINGALLAALKQFGVTERPRLLVFMTDGLPTVGETNVARIVENARRERAQGTRLFTFGVGYDVNTALLDKLAAENGGVADYVEPKEDLEVKVSNFFAKVNHPVLTDLRLDTGGLETDLLYPRELPDLFRGTQLTLLGRYRNAHDLSRVRLRLTGRAGARERAFTYENLSFPVRETDNDFLPRLWATRRVGWLMEQVRTNGEQKELRDEIVELGTRYGIVTPYTSYLALEPNAVVPWERGDRDSPRPLPLNNRGIVRALPSPRAPMAAGAATGAVAVQESKRARAQQEALSVVIDETDSRAVRRVGSKTFYLIEGVWTDVEFKAEARLPETKLSFASEDYFALLKHEPRLAPYFALAERVVVVLDGRVYRVNATSN